MTAQTGDELIYEGRKVCMSSEPLGDYFVFSGNKPEFQITCTALWRGYIGTWEIINDRLYLVGLSEALMYGEEATVETIFPGYPDRVFAHWYTGTLRIQEGELLDYVHMGYASTYERDRFLKVEKGVIAGSRVRQNSVVEGSGGAEGFDIGALTVLTQHTSNEDDNRYQPKEFAVTLDHLLKRLTLDEIEKTEVVSDSLGAAPRLPFGHLNQAWEDFKQSILDGDQLWSFSAPWTTGWGQEEVRDGYVVLRGETIGPHFLTLWLILRKER